MYLISGLAHLHTIFLVNSLAHLHGTRPYTPPGREGHDNSHNIWWLAPLTFGEGWHFNHHSFPSSAKVGLRWYELDLGWLFLRLLAVFGVVWDLKTPAPRELSSLRPASPLRELSRP